MLFNSIDFALFLPVVFLLYWFVVQHNLRLQNFFLVVASYVFYGWWDWHFLFLMFFSSLVDYAVGLLMDKTETQRRRKLLLWLSLLVNLGLLGFFKYYNFFVDNFVAAFSLFGVKFQAATLNIVLPVGISFYTFQTMSYSIDVYRRNLRPTRDFIAFFAYISFFPQLVAGPIERATHLLPQFYNSRHFSYDKAVDGLRQILWGLFKKVVIADNCAEYANMAFDSSAGYSGSTLALGALLFTFQIYGDFSGYSDMAVGLSRLFGFDLMRNFAFPYFSRDIAEFWRRWHISLSTWFRDYIYIPLGGSQGGMWLKVRNTFIIFLVSGFWHGANWTFIVWGLLNAIYFLPLLLLQRNRNNLGTVAQERWLPSFRELIAMGITFALTVFAWIFFRAENLDHAFTYLYRMFSLNTLLATPAALPTSTIVLVGIFVAIEWIGREGQHALQCIGLRWHRAFRWIFYCAIITLIIRWGGNQQDFIYFQF